MARSRSPFPRTWASLGLILGFALLIFLGDAFHLFETQELGFLDLRFRLRGPRTPHPDIVIVEIDDQSVSRIGHWPWPRSYHATLLNVLSTYEPRLILYDVLFTEASPQPDEDTLLAYAMEKAGNVIAAFFFHSEEPFTPFFPLKPFREVGRYLGYVNIFPDADAGIRRIRKSIHPEEGTYYHTSVIAALARFRDETEGRRWVESVPVDQENSFWINYPGKYSVFPRIPFYEIIEGEGAGARELQRLFQGKIVVVGQTATGGGDFRPTPFSPAYPGVGIQASAIHTLLTGDYLHRLGALFSLVIIFASTLLVTFLTWKNPPRWGLIAVWMVAAFYLVLNNLAFHFFGWILPVFPVLLVIVGTYILALFFQFLEFRFQGELLARELSLASRIQENFLPQHAPEIEGLEIGFQCRFARTVGGDLCDWVTLGERRLGVCVGDVSGKGVPAALYMARAISEFRSLAKDFNSTSALMGALNARLLESGSSGIFVTLLYLILDLDSQSILLSNAGHEPLLFYRSRSHEMEWIRRGGAQPLGLFPEIQYPEESLRVEKGDRVVLISDGVRELLSPSGKEFGLGGVEKALDSYPEGSADQTVKRLFQAMDGFSKGKPAHDDRTVLCIKVEKGGG